jgi:hypothetical protein
LEISLVFSFVLEGRSDPGETNQLGAYGQVPILSTAQKCRGFAEAMAYQQAQIPVTKTEEFEQLKSALERILTPAAVESFYKKLQGRTVYVRDFEKMISSGIVEELDSALRGSRKTARQLYESLALSDQALMREFYLERIEQVDVKVREKYRKVYRYY